MRRTFYLTLLVAFACIPSSVSASECGRPMSDGVIPTAVDSLYILQSAVGDDSVDLDCNSECPTIVPCGAEDAPMCNGTCPAEQACMPVEDDGEDHDDRVTICHFPPGNPGNVHTLVVGESATGAHLRHGDELGPCEDLDMGLAIFARHEDRDEDGDSDSDGDSDHTTMGATTTTTTMGPATGDADCICLPVSITTTTTMMSATTTTMNQATTTTMGATTTTTLGPSIASGQAIYDDRCQFCHAAGAHDMVDESAGQLARKGSKLQNDLGAIARPMTGIVLTNQELADLAVFLDSL